MTDTPPPSSPPDPAKTKKAYRLSPALDGVPMPNEMREWFERYEQSVMQMERTDPGSAATRESRNLLQLDEHQYAQITREIKEISNKTGAYSPDLYFKQDNTPNAIPDIVNGRPAIIFNTKEERILTGPGETEGVVAHEMAHHMLEHLMLPDQLTDWLKDLQRNLKRPPGSQREKALATELKAIEGELKFEMGIGPNPQQAREFAADAKAIELTCRPDGSNLEARKNTLIKEDAAFPPDPTEKTLQQLANEENARRANLRKRAPKTLGEAWEKAREILFPRPPATEDSMYQESIRIASHPPTEERIAKLEEAYKHYCGPLPTPHKDKAVLLSPPAK